MFLYYFLGERKVYLKRLISTLPFILLLAVISFVSSSYRAQILESGALIQVCYFALFSGLGVITGVVGYTIHSESYSKRYYIVGGIIFTLLGTLLLIFSLTRNPVSLIGILVVCAASGYSLGNIGLSIKKQK